MNSVSAIPIGACLIGRMGNTQEDRRNIPFQIFKTVAGLVSELFFPAIEIFGNILRVFSREPPELPKIFYGRAVHFISNGLGPQVSVPEALRHVEGSCGELGLRELNQHQSIRRAEVKALIQRIFMGLFGGIALICPVLIMALSSSQKTNLITVSVATIVFAILLAIGASDSTGKDVLSATAAYTAVLVVFFGTSSS